MKKTLTINLGGTVFHIEDDAYLKLEKYLDGLKIQFKNDPDGKEIINDIEERLAEIFRTELTDLKQAVTIIMVEKAVNMMGTATDIADDVFAEEEKPRSGKKLYRDVNNKVFGGVCSGLAQYINIDITLLRILFVVFLFVTSFGLFFVYLVLWLVLPEAVSTAQRMEMRGEAVNITSIEKKVKDKSQNPPKKNSKNNPQADGVGETILKIIAWVIGGFFITIVLLIMLSVLAAIFGLTIATSVLGGFLPDLFHSSGVMMNLPHDFIAHTGQSVLGLILFIGAPVLLILFIVSKMAFKHNGKVGLVVLLSLFLWIAGIVLLATSSINFIEKAARMDIDFLGDDNNKTIVVNGDTIMSYNEDFDDEFRVRLNSRKSKIDYHSGENTIKYSTSLTAQDTLILSLSDKLVQNKNNDDYEWITPKYIVSNSPQKEVQVFIALDTYAYKFDKFKLADPLFKWEKTNNSITLPSKIGYKRKKNHKGKAPEIQILVPDEMMVMFKNNMDENVNNFSTETKEMIQSNSYYVMRKDAFYLSK